MTCFRRPNRNSMNRNSGQSRLELWGTKCWPKTLVAIGLILFAATCLAGESLPVESILVGPGLMLAGVIMIARDRRTGSRAG
jgi:hypothetical protein